MALGPPPRTGEAFLVVGEAVVDEVVAADGTVTAHPGGSPANVALGLARLGRPVRLLTELGDDAYGGAVRDHLEASGVVVDARRSARTSTARATLADDGSARYSFDIDWRLTPDGEAGATGDAVDVSVGHVHTGSLASVLAPGAATVAALLRRHRGGATTSYDPNVRPSLAGDHELAVATVERLIALSDVVKASDEDAAWLYPQASLAEVADRWRLLRPTLVVLTRGAQGALARTSAGWADVAPVAVPVADTVGAGDAFMAALLDGLTRAGLLGIGRRPFLATASVPALQPLLDRAARAAALTVSRPGADPPTARELDLPAVHDPAHPAGAPV